MTYCSFAISILHEYALAQFLCLPLSPVHLQQLGPVSHFYIFMCSAVSSFDPDSRFISNVLSRLEAVMGIQIVSALANIHSQLITSLGVQRPDYNPDLDIYPHKYVTDVKELICPADYYVKEVISQWSAGCSHRPPTWRHLLEVLRDIGLVELSQQIDIFFKSTANAYKYYCITI